MFKTFEQFNLNHVQSEIPAPEEDIVAYQHLKNNVDKYIHKDKERKVFLNGFKYLTSPIILDDFEEHIDRREWLKTLETYPKIHKHLQTNRLRVNTLSAINRLIAMSYFFIEDINMKDVQIRTIIEQANENIKFLRIYQKLPIQEKIQFSKRSATLARKFIEKIIK